MIENNTDEIRRFKEQINLSAYAATLGYTIDRRESSKNSIVMRRESDGDKIIVATSGHDHGIYFSIRDETDHGTIVDFIQKRKGLSLGQVRKELRPWIGIGGWSPKISPEFYRPAPSTKDRQAVLLAWQRARVLDDYGYLNSRGLTREDLESVGVDDITKMDGYGNVLFGHYDEMGLCGFEVKNTRFTGFAKGGQKALWVAGHPDEPTRIVVGESAISVLSYAKLHPDKQAVYASFGGSWNDKQPGLLKLFFDKFPGAGIIAVVDNDQGGDDYTAALDELAPGRVERHSPAPRGEDWNDVLTDELKRRRRQRQQVPAPAL